MPDEDKSRALVELLAGMSSEDIVATVSQVFAQRAELSRDSSGAVKYLTSYLIADVSYSAPDDVMAEFIGFDAARRRRAGFDEQGRCERCCSFVCSEVKEPLCPICETLVACT